MATIVYILSSLTCIACAVLLLRSWRRGGGSSKLLLCSGLCFAGLALNNGLATIDVNTANDMLDLSTIRLAISLTSVSILIFGLTWESV
ncbi:MAG: hypothetical protein EOP07_08175 [Proteobacteria bacterium]|nr:MAG: hypothetical protein EOP07_08175 [Pseudomonadota bacterium]